VSEIDIISAIKQNVVVFSIFKLLFGGYFCAIILLPIENTEKI